MRFLDRCFPRRVFSRWKKAKERALEIYERIPENHQDLSPEFFDEISNNSPNCSYRINDLDSTVIEKPTLELQEEFTKRITCEFKKCYGENDDIGFNNYVFPSTKGNKTNFLFVSERYYSNMDKQNVFSIGYDVQDKKSWVVNAYVGCYSGKKSRLGLIAKLAAVVYLLAMVISIVADSGEITYPVILAAVVFFVGAIFAGVGFLAFLNYCAGTFPVAAYAKENHLPSRLYTDEWFPPDHEKFVQCYRNSLSVFENAAGKDSVLDQVDHRQASGSTPV